MAISSRRRCGALVIIIAACASALAAPAGAQGTAPLTISLDDALRLGAGVSHVVRTAEAGVQRARGQQAQALSQYFPQVTATAGYQRTLQSQFNEIQKKDKSSGSSAGGSSDSSSNSFGSIGKIFASPVTETIGLNFSQNLFTAGRVGAARAAADAARTVADIGLDAAKAQAALDIAQAYFDAVAAGQLVEIADSTLAQAERSLQNTTLANEVGSASEFDLLRARVARDNARPSLIQARGNRDVALLRLRQLLGVPLSQPIALSTPIHDEGTPAPPASAAQPTVMLDRPIAIPGTTRAVLPDTSAANRSSVRQAEAAVEAQQAALRAASWQRLPSLQVSSTYQRFAYPADGTFAPNSFGLFYPNWTVTAGFSFPLFTGGRIGGDRLVAEANLGEARENLAQAREYAALDARTAVTQLEQAQAAYSASVGTDEQAGKAYSIAEVRQREGISTEVELQQARTQYEQARLNRVLAARDLEVARLRVALLKDLPLAAATTTTGRR
ncbi:MAG TPA: TolC family protein [Gemmatimonadaceae bacterium]|nr:TolC family protein [Gemmatimonadaceae bacterium]